MLKITKNIRWYCNICETACNENNSGSGISCTDGKGNYQGEGYCYKCEIKLAKRIVKEVKNGNCKQSNNNITYAKSLLKTYNDIK